MMIYNFAKIIARDGGRLGAIEHRALGVLGMIEARALHVLVSSDHHSADERVAKAIARVLSRYAVDLGPEVEVKVSHHGVEVPYTARPAMSLASLVREARTRSRASRS